MVPCHITGTLNLSLFYFFETNEVQRLPFTGERGAGLGRTDGRARLDLRYIYICHGNKCFYDTNYMRTLSKVPAGMGMGEERGRTRNPLSRKP